jgi:NADH-quinone oxidoreductase subunit C
MNVKPALDPIQAVQAAFPGALQDVVEYAGETTLVIDAAQLAKVSRYLRDTAGLIYNFLSDISAVDYYEPTGGISGRPARFGVCYHIYSMLYNRRLRVKVYVDEQDDGSNPIVPSVVGVWPAGNWLEREAADMMGIVFEGNPDQRRLLMPDDWQGHPHRRDYPLGYETVQFSFNAEEIMKHKPFAKE